MDLMLVYWCCTWRN